MSDMNSEKMEEVKGLLRESLFFLCTEFLGYKDWDKVHDDVEIFLKRKAKKKALLMPRNHLKSSMVTIAKSIQWILEDPNVRILIGNGVWDMSRSFLDEIKAHLKDSKLKYLFGEFESARWNADEIIVKQRVKALKEPTIRTTGVEAENTGGHFDKIILDDLTGLQNSQTAEQRAKTKRFRRSMMNLLEPGGELIEIGTRWHLDDTFSDVLGKESRYYNIMVRKVIEDGKLIFPKKFAKKFDVKLKDWISVDDPMCFDYVDSLKDSMPADEFSSQYLNEPMTAENQLFKPEYFKYWDEKPDGLHVVMCVDLASSQSVEADYTALAVVGMDKDYKIYALDYIRGKWHNPSDIVDNIFQMRDKWKPHILGMETNGFQYLLKLSVENEMRKRKNYFPIDEVRNGPKKSKFDRIKCMEPFYRSGDFFHALWMKNKDYETELQTVSGEGIKGKHDDLMDAFSMTLPFLNPGMEIRQGNGDDYGSWDYWVKVANGRNFGKGILGYGA